MQLRGISPLITPEVLAGLAHLQEGHLVAVVGEGFPRLPRRLWGSSPWPMSGPREVVLDDTGVRDVLEGLLVHVPVDAFYWSTDHDRELPGYLSQVRWQVASWSDGRAGGDRGVPSDQLLEMARTAELLLRTSEARCNSPIVLRVGGLPSPRPPRRLGGKLRDKPATKPGDGGPATADAVADAAVQTTPRLARSAKLSLLAGAGAGVIDLSPPASPTPALRNAGRAAVDVDAAAATGTPADSSGAPAGQPVPRPRAPLQGNKLPIADLSAPSTVQTSDTATSPTTSTSTPVPSSTATAHKSFPTTQSAPQSAPGTSPAPTATRATRAASPEDSCYVELQTGARAAAVAVFARRNASPQRPLQAQASQAPPPPVADARFQEVSVANAVQNLEAAARPTSLPPREPAPRSRLKQPAFAVKNDTQDTVPKSETEDAAPKSDTKADVLESDAKNEPNSAVKSARKPKAVLRKQVSFSDLVQEIPHLADEDHAVDSADAALPETQHQGGSENGQGSGPRVSGETAVNGHEACSVKVDSPPSDDPRVDQVDSPGTAQDHGSKLGHSQGAETSARLEPATPAGSQSQARAPRGVNNPQRGEQPDVAPHRLSLRGRIVPDILPVNMARAVPKVKKTADASKAPYRSVPLCLPSPFSAAE